MAEDKNDSIIKRLFKIFSFKVDKDKKKNKERIVITKPFSLEPENFPSYVEQLYNAWRTSQTNLYSFEDRKKMYAEMDNMFESNAIMNNALELRVHEIVQGDVNNEIIQVECYNNEIEKEIKSFLNRVDIDSYLFPTAYNLIKYGDAGWILTFNESGIMEILNVDPYDIDDRIEFTPHDLEKQLRGYNLNSLFRNITNDTKFKMLIDMIKSNDDYATFFRSYLFGFQVGSFVLPPWRFLHFRNFQTNSFFSPFGVPAYIYSLSSVKLYDMALGLQILSRQARMPIDVYKLSFPAGGMPTDKLELAVQFIRQWQASGLRQVRKENIGLGESIITIQNLFEYEQIVPSIDLGRIEDIEMLRDDIILSAGIPRNFVDPNNGSFGNSGVALIEQFKPFARKVYKDQSIIMNEISQLIKIHLILRGYKLKDIDFKISMPYPESQTNNEIISSQRELFSLANEILDGIKDRIGDDVPLPVDLIRSVYKKITAFDPSTVDSWIDIFVAEREKQEKESSNDNREEDEEGMDFTFESIKREIGEKELNKIVENEIGKGLVNHKLEHTKKGRHYLSSRKNNLSFNAETFENIERNVLRKLLNEEYSIASKDDFDIFKNNLEMNIKKKKLKELYNKKKESF
ncbi:MAG: hypothetical protein N2169_06525 [bacterium]|nr:hypothetical protein [bacterium]